MEPQQLFESVQLAAPTAQLVRLAATALAGALATMAFCVASLRATLLGDGRGYGEWALRLIVVVALLGAYESVIRAILTASGELALFFAEQAGWDAYWSTVVDSFEPLMESQSPAWERLLGWVRGGALNIAVTVSYYLQFMVFEGVQYLASVFAALLYVFGPLMIAGGLIGGGQSAVQWAGSLIQVALWPSVPPFLMLVIVQTGSNALQTGNVPYILAQNVTLTLLGVLSPAIVAFIFGRGGVGLFAGAAVALGVRGLGVVVRAAQSLDGMHGAIATAGMHGAGAGTPGAPDAPDAGGPRPDDPPRFASEGPEGAADAEVFQEDTPASAAARDSRDRGPLAAAGAAEGAAARAATERSTEAGPDRERVISAQKPEPALTRS